MSAISANSAVFARKAVVGKAVAAKRTATRARAAFNVSASAKVDACDKNSVIVSPSILSADFANLGAEVRANSPARGSRDCFDAPETDGQKGSLPPPSRTSDVLPLVIDAACPRAVVWSDRPGKEDKIVDRASSPP